jgi:hypothetical protein
MTVGEPRAWLRDPELVRLRREWVRAYHAWMSIADDSSPDGEPLTDALCEAERRYHAAEAAYFERSRALSGECGALPNLAL